MRGAVPEQAVGFLGAGLFHQIAHTRESRRVRQVMSRRRSRIGCASMLVGVALNSGEDLGRCRNPINWTGLTFRSLAAKICVVDVVANCVVLTLCLLYRHRTLTNESGC